MIKQYFIPSTIAVLTSFLLISSATAVPYTQLNAFEQETEIIDKLQNIINNEHFGNLQWIAEQEIDEEIRGELRNGIESLLFDKGVQQVGSQFEILVDIFVDIAEILLLLFGYNPIGAGITVAIVGLLALTSMIIVAVPYTAILIYDISILFFSSIINSENIINEIITNFGLIGAAILFILFLPAYLVMAALSYIPVYCILVFTETISIVNDVISRIQF